MNAARPSPLPHRDAAQACLAVPGRWDERERDFLRRLSCQRRDPSPAQVRWLAQLAARAQGADQKATPDQVVAAFLDAMKAFGIEPTEPIGGKLGSGLIRFRCEGDGEGKRNGWAVLHFDGQPAGRFGNYRLAINRGWRFGADVDPTAAAEWERVLSERQRQREQERREMWEAAAERARCAWAAAGPADPAHPYLARKKLTGEGLRQIGLTLLVPMRDGPGRLWNIQRIYPNGRKIFGIATGRRGEGGRTEGLFFLCGEPGEALCVGEGWATMAAVRLATGHPIAAAVTGANLEPVARILRTMFPDVDMIICADDDAALVRHPTIRRNLGVDYARAAAIAVGGRLAMPPRKGIAA